MAQLKMSKEDKAREERWKVESAMDTIRRYNELQKDKALLGKVRTATEQQLMMLGGMVKKSAPARKPKK
jgi:hypothetical protein